MPSSSWCPNAEIETLKKRARLLASTRAFFDARSAIEVDTPMLSSAALTSPEIESYLAVLSHQAHLAGGYENNGSAGHGYLHTSPEFPMKRLLAAGLGDCYQLCHVFRGEEQGSQHNSEFMLLEWYRVGWSMSQLMDEVAALILELFSVFAPARAPQNVITRTYQSLFLEYLDIDPLSADVGTLRETAEQALGADTISEQQRKTYDQDAWLYYLMSMVIEPKLPKAQLVFVTEYPISQAALARQNPHEQRTAMRFECYLGGLELANGFDELTNADEQLYRFEQENQMRTDIGLPAMPIDKRLITALQDMPPCSGVALGFDRLAMLVFAKSHIAEVMAFDCTRA